MIYHIYIYIQIYIYTYIYIYIYKYREFYIDLKEDEIDQQTLQFHRGDIGLHQEKMRCLPK